MLKGFFFAYHVIIFFFMFVINLNFPGKCLWINLMIAYISLVSTAAGQSALALDRPTDGHNNHIEQHFPLPVFMGLASSQTVDMANKNNLNRA